MDTEKKENHNISSIKTLSFDTKAGKDNKLIPYELDPTYKQIYIINKDDFHQWKNSLDVYFQRIPPIIKKNNTGDKGILDYEVWTPKKVNKGKGKIKELINKIMKKEEQDIEKDPTRKYRYKRIGKTNEFKIMKPEILTIPTTDEDNIPVIISTDESSMLGVPMITTTTMLGVPTTNTMVGMSAGKKNRKHKKIRKHKGIIQIGGNKGKLRKGYRYSGKKLKSGLPQIIKCKSKY